MHCLADSISRLLSPNLRNARGVWRNARGVMGKALTPLTVMLLAIAGCSSEPPAGTVTGEVLLNGEAYDAAAVMLIDKSTGQAFGTDIEAGGKFAIDQPVPVGTYSVYLAPKSVPLDDGAPEAIKIDETVPQKYWNEGTTDIEKQVEAGENDLTIEFVSS